ncbi:MAG: hypothetical protein JXA57_15840 [Armatimonadetes bacterium]|nr:hypothetical protein [Armatimonadota bacterium]
MQSTFYRARLRVPNAAIGYEESLQVYNLDLPSLSPSELEEQIFLAQRIAAHDPAALVWRGLDFVSARQWADERISRARELLAKPVGPAPRKPARKHKARAWT